MGQISTQEELRKAIAMLEQKQLMQGNEIKQDFLDAKHAFRPGNVIKNTFSRLAEIPEVKQTMINTMVGFGLGYVSRKASMIMNEESLDNIASNLVVTQLNKMEQKDPDSFLSKAISFVRKNIKRGSPLHPFLGYRNSY